MSLRLFLDSADPAQWRCWLPGGLFHGVTTNPTLLQRAGLPCRPEALAELVELARELRCRELHLQAWGQEADRLESCGRTLHRLAPERVVVKLPVTREGSKAAARLIAGGVPVTFTACYEVAQVLIAAALGARYIAPYLGRICDQDRDGHAELIAMNQALRGVGSDVRLLAASVRRPADLGRLAAAGLDTFTLAPEVVAELLACEATAAAAAAFEQHAAAGGGNASA
ncbi:transaldolase [Cyanobium sp. FGCU-52]|nr:transaldolase [Cyanobium sp. FGCU52]